MEAFTGFDVGLELPLNKVQVEFSYVQPHLSPYLPMNLQVGHRWPWR